MLCWPQLSAFEKIIWELCDYEQNQPRTKLYCYRETSICKIPLNIPPFKINKILTSAPSSGQTSRFKKKEKMALLEGSLKIYQFLSVRVETHRCLSIEFLAMYQKWTPSRQRRLNLLSLADRRLSCTQWHRNLAWKVMVWRKAGISISTVLSMDWQRMSDTLYVKTRPT